MTMRTALAALLALLPALTLGQVAQTVNICDRTPQVRDAILQVQRINDCAAVIPGLLDHINLERLSLSDLGLTTLQNGDFAGLFQLRSINLSNNALKALPEGVFSGLDRLRELSLANNLLKTLPKDLLRDINLTTLSLQGNRLTSLPEGIFGDSTNLTTLYLQGNHLVGLTREDPLFARLPSDAFVFIGLQTSPPEQPDPPEQPEQPETPTTPEQPEQPETPTTPSGNDGLAAKVDALQTRMDGLAGSVDRLAASFDALRETLGQRMDNLEAEVADAPGSRLLIVPMNQADNAREPSE